MSPPWIPAVAQAAVDQHPEGQNGEQRRGLVEAMAPVMVKVAAAVASA